MCIPKIKQESFCKAKKSNKKRICYSEFLSWTIKNSRSVFFNILTRVVIGACQWCLGVPGLNIALKAAARCLTMMREAAVSKDSKSRVDYRDAIGFGRLMVLEGVSEESMGLISAETSSGGPNEVSGDQTSSTTSTSNSTSTSSSNGSSSASSTSSHNSGSASNTSNTSNSGINSVSRVPQDGFTTPLAQVQRIRTNPNLPARGNNLANVNNVNNIYSSQNPQEESRPAAWRQLDFDQ
jgi:hypothetical protein